MVKGIEEDKVDGSVRGDLGEHVDGDEAGKAKGGSLEKVGKGVKRPFENLCRIKLVSYILTIDKLKSTFRLELGKLGVDVLQVGNGEEDRLQALHAGRIR